MATSAEEMAAQAEQLKILVKFFKLDNRSMRENRPANQVEKKVLQHKGAVLNNPGINKIEISEDGEFESF